MELLDINELVGLPPANPSPRMSALSAPLRDSFVGEVGDMSGGASSVVSAPPVTTPRQDMLTAPLRAGPPARLPLPVSIAAPVQEPASIAAPVVPPSQPAAASRQRELMHNMGLTMATTAPSPAQRVQGLQLMMQSRETSPEEQAATDRERLTGLIDSSDADDAAKRRARIAVGFGAKPEQLMEALGIGEKGQAAELAKKEKFAKFLSSQATGASTGAVLRDAEEQSIDIIDKGSKPTGTLGWATSLLPGTDASRLEEAIRPIKAIIGFDRLQQMREESKTGGALGAVAVRELEFLQAVQGSLAISQDRQVIKNNMRAIVESHGLFQQLRALAPALEAGDSRAVDKYVKLHEQLGSVRTQIKSQVADSQNVPGESDFEKKYGGR